MLAWGCEGICFLSPGAFPKVYFRQGGSLRNPDVLDDSWWAPLLLHFRPPAVCVPVGAQSYKHRGCQRPHTCTRGWGAGREPGGAPRGRALRTPGRRSSTEGPQWDACRRDFSAPWWCSLHLCSWRSALPRFSRLGCGLLLFTCAPALGSLLEVGSLYSGLIPGFLEALLLRPLSSALTVHWDAVEGPGAGSRLLTVLTVEVLRLHQSVELSPPLPSPEEGARGCSARASFHDVATVLGIYLFFL